MKQNYRHGDLSFHSIDKLPEGLKKIKYQDEFVLAEGEYTGHKHAVKGSGLEIYQDKEGRYYLVVNQSATITHQEHKPITFLPGIYRQEQELERDPFLNEIRKTID